MDRRFGAQASIPKHADVDALPPRLGLLEYLAGGMSEDQILGDFPDLTRGHSSLSGFRRGP